MTVTALEERKKGMSAVFIDGEYAMMLDTFTLAKEGIKVGSDIDDDTLHEVIKQSNYNRAKEKALNLIEYRSRSRKEIVERLRPLYGEEAAMLAADKMVDLGLVNDNAFARDLAYELLNRKKYGAKRAVYELMRKGVDRELADEVIEELSPDPQEQIHKLLETKYAKKLYDDKSRKKTANAIAALGYSYSDINAVMRELDNEFY